MHKKVAEDIVSGNKNLSTLEIGAGTLNHLQYEPAQEIYDIMEPFKELYEGSPLLKNIRKVYDDISDVTNTKYQRRSTIATFEHILDLLLVVAKSAILLNENNGHL
jgi:hypothetical protein